MKSDALPFSYVDGPKKDHGVTLYALSTCAFCRRGVQFLRTHGVAFRYLYVDKLPQETKQALREDLRRRFSAQLIYPYLVVDQRSAVGGFYEDRWRSLLELSQGGGTGR